MTAIRRSSRMIPSGLSANLTYGITSGLSVTQAQWDKNSYKQAQIVAVGSLREKHQGLSI
jgi:hypothetical protein